MRSDSRWKLSEAEKREMYRGETEKCSPWGKTLNGDVSRPSSGWTDQDHTVASYKQHRYFPICFLQKNQFSFLFFFAFKTFDKSCRSAKVSATIHGKQHTINQSINLTINQSINQSNHQSINQSMHQSIDQSMHQSINQSVDRSYDELKEFSFSSLNFRKVFNFYSAMVKNFWNRDTDFWYRKKLFDQGDLVVWIMQRYNNAQ